MKNTQLLGLVLIITGLISAVYGSLHGTHTATEARLGPFSLSVQHKPRINIPLWAGIGGIVVGGGLWLVADRTTTPSSLSTHTTPIALDWADHLA